MGPLLTVIKSMYLCFFYTVINVFSSRQIKYNESNGYIISLTTYHKRIKYVFLTIESLANQRFKPSKIILWLSKDDIIDNNVPASLKRLQSRGLEIEFVDNNIRSYKKLSHFCEKKEQYLFDYVVTADDDVFYPNYWLEMFHIKNTESPGYVYCYRGKLIQFENGHVCEYNQWASDVDSCNKSSKLLMPTGVSGVCYPKKVLTDSFADVDGFSDNCMFADDIWYKFCSLLNGFGAKLVLDKNIHFIPVLFSLGKGLEVNNVHNGMNTIQFNNALSYFKMTSQDFNN